MKRYPARSVSAYADSAPSSTLVKKHWHFPARRGEKCPTVYTLYKIAQGLKIPLSELLDVTAEINPTHKAAIDRIETAIFSLSENEAVEIAEIIEKLIAFKRDNA